MAKPPIVTTPLLPEAAIVKGVAKGAQRDRVGVYGSSVTAPGIWANAEMDVGLYAYSERKSGVLGESADAAGVFGRGGKTEGVRGESAHGAGVLGKTDYAGFEAIRGETSTKFAALGAYSTNVTEGVALWAEKTGQGLAGLFKGDVRIEGLGANKDGGVALWVERRDPGSAGLFKGDVKVEGELRVTVDVILGGEDCAEEFDLDGTSEVEPGTLMVLGLEGVLLPSTRAYDKCAAGVVSGAGTYRPGLILGRKEPGCPRVAIAMLGKVYCKADARLRLSMWAIC